jgi:MFS family permease
MLVLTASDATAGARDASNPGNPGSLALFFLGMGVLGIAAAFLGSAPAAVVGDVMGERRGGIVVAAYQMVSDLGAIVGPLVAGWLVDVLDFDWAFATGAVVSAGALMLVVAMPETLGRGRRPESVATDESGGTAQPA